MRQQRGGQRKKYDSEQNYICTHHLNVSMQNLPMKFSIRFWAWQSTPWQLKPERGWSIKFFANIRIFRPVFGSYLLKEPSSIVFKLGRQFIVAITTLCGYTSLSVLGWTTQLLSTLWLIPRTSGISLSPLKIASRICTTCCRLKSIVGPWDLIIKKKKHPADKQTLQNSLGVRCPHSRRIWTQFFWHIFGDPRKFGVFKQEIFERTNVV